MKTHKYLQCLQLCDKEKTRAKWQCCTDVSRPPLQPYAGDDTRLVRVCASKPNIPLFTAPHHNTRGPISAPLANYVPLWVTVAGTHLVDLPLAANVGAPVMRRCDGAHVRLQMLCREPCCVAIVSGTYGLVVLVCVCVHFLCFLCEDLYQGCEVMAVLPLAA